MGRELVNPSGNSFRYTQNTPKQETIPRGSLRFTSVTLGPSLVFSSNGLSWSCDSLGQHDSPHQDSFPTARFLFFSSNIPAVTWTRHQPYRNHILLLLVSSATGRIRWLLVCWLRRDSRFIRIPHFLKGRGPLRTFGCLWFVRGPPPHHHYDRLQSTAPHCRHLCVYTTRVGSNPLFQESRRFHHSVPVSFQADSANKSSH